MRILSCGEPPSSSESFWQFPIINILSLTLAPVSNGVQFLQLLIHNTELLLQPQGILVAFLLFLLDGEQPLILLFDLGVKLILILYFLWIQ